MLKPEPLTAHCSLLTVKHLTLAYGERIILRDLNLSVNAGEFVGLLGPKGSGKSTLLAGLTGVLPPQGGQVRYNGTALGDWRPQALARQVATVPQFNWISFPFSCFEVVLMGRYPYRRRFQGETPEDLAVARRAMADIGISHLAPRLITQISGGERQMVILSRALAQDTDLRLRDELCPSHVNDHGAGGCRADSFHLAAIVLLRVTLHRALAIGKGGETCPTRQLRLPSDGLPLTDEN